MSEPKISIVFTSYNHKEFLNQALDCLINQTFKDFELIIVDDCSTDGSQEILTEYSTDERVKLFLQEKNSGSYVHSTNFGASKAVAEYIIFAQCDDFAQATQLEVLYNAMISHPTVGVVFSSSRMVDESGSDLGSDYELRARQFRSRCVTDTVIKNDEIQKFFLKSCVIPNLSAALVKRSIFESTGGLSSNYLVLADWDFWLRVTLDYDFYYVRESLNNFRQHDTTIRNSVKLNRQILEVFDMYYNFFDYSKLVFFKKFSCEVNIAFIWFGYFKSSKKIWLKSFFPLLSESLKYCDYFRFVFLIALFLYPFKALSNKMQKL